MKNPAKLQSKGLQMKTGQLHWETGFLSSPLDTLKQEATLPRGGAKSRPLSRPCPLSGQKPYRQTQSCP